ncbi:hypothetical protein [Streptomyces albipurpureus]|uniref:Uncharacterized protein n=1 Tax=Streptomyces albipurpureus TaxID=2897419 RepID=A0ABT0UGJ5_9ACTN|nr:hypothetical protein [Streptomyces sp. CWNU-1]MCM2387144.1 hypothetical protein [Streptomyces sp. CWNU-1]
MNPGAAAALLVMGIGFLGFTNGHRLLGTVLLAAVSMCSVRDRPGPMLAG